MALTYYITAREQIAPGADAAAQEAALQEHVRAAFRAGMDYVQVREKDLPGRRLASLADKLAALPEKKLARLLINERLDIAAACGADGVHLPSNFVPASAVRRAATKEIILGVSCHSEEDVREAVRREATYVLLAPIFATPSKPGTKPLGLTVLEAVCEWSPIPVLALGGVDATNAAECVLAGAAGVAGIRLFQQARDLNALCARLRAMG